MKALIPATHCFDIIGVGFGPANIALAIALEEMGSQLSVRFLERRSSTTWQEEMRLPESDIQNHPLRDLVTPRNPRSRYSFTNFLFENNRLFEHLNLPLHFPLRVEYEQYVAWVAGFFDHQVEYGCEVVAIDPVTTAEEAAVEGYRITDREGKVWYARSVVVAPGRTANVPDIFKAVDHPGVVHLTEYLTGLNRVLASPKKPRVAVIGGSQSAVEIMLHAYGTDLTADVVGITRNFGYRQKDTSPFSEEVYFPAFVDTFYGASQAVKDKLRRELVFTNYSSVDKDVLDSLYVKLYSNRIMGKSGLSVITNTEIEHVASDDQGVHLSLHNTATNVNVLQSFDLVVLATGFLDLGSGSKREPYPKLLNSIASLMELHDGALQVEYNYRIRLTQRHRVGAPIFLNGLCESSHGMGDAGSFSLLAQRSAAIVEAIEDDHIRHTAKTETIDAVAELADQAV